MAIVQCSDCGRDVSASARACPHCGRARPARVSAGRATALIAAIVLLMAGTWVAIAVSLLAGVVMIATGAAILYVTEVRGGGETRT